MEKKKLKQIYGSILGSLKNVMDIDQKLSNYRNIDYHSLTENEVFELLTRSIFTGIRNNIISDRWSAITNAFLDFNIDKVAKFTEKDVGKLMKNSKIIRHKDRIRATISNAKKMQRIIREFGSFANHIDSFKNEDELIEKLQGYYGGFGWVGEVNVYEFAKEIGLPFIKPDIQIKRVFLRLGLTNKKASPEEIVQIGKAMAVAVNEKPAVIDCALWYFGRIICSRKPLCEKCSVTECRFRNM
jgi:endonuclease III